jgi:hypothetical protein
MEEDNPTWFLARNALPDNSHPVMSRTLRQAQGVPAKICEKYDDPDYNKASLEHWFTETLNYSGRERRHM